LQQVFLAMTRNPSRKPGIDERLERLRLHVIVLFDPDALLRFERS
jgi:hypothetical protein